MKASEDIKKIHDAKRVFDMVIVSKYLLVKGMANPVFQRKHVLVIHRLSASECSHQKVDIF
jgi:hypothetical protein